MGFCSYSKEFSLSSYTNVENQFITKYMPLADGQEDKKYLKITIAKGYETPYHIKGMGMTPDSCFIRVGSSNEKMDEHLKLE